ncbi:hypothetical protein Nepgr_015821 [Nepenthes gracilis]|uniref:Uncharacterized protein n=1 Tax=Nepenthes gracilis TaxID=150966 RepID=A0AAD3XRZ3_NEPGR|nr:hypothetical protein Nepgr_015821 [Nepenthes gracilis]
MYSRPSRGLQPEAECLLPACLRMLDSLGWPCALVVVVVLLVMWWCARPVSVSLGLLFAAFVDSRYYRSCGLTANRFCTGKMPVWIVYRRILAARLRLSPNCRSGFKSRFGFEMKCRSRIASHMPISIVSSFRLLQAERDGKLYFPRWELSCRSRIVIGVGPLVVSLCALDFMAAFEITGPIWFHKGRFGFGWQHGLRAALLLHRCSCKFIVSSFVLLLNFGLLEPGLYALSYVLVAVHYSVGVDEAADDVASLLDESPCLDVLLPDDYTVFAIVGLAVGSLARERW